MADVYYKKQNIQNLRALLKEKGGNPMVDTIPFLVGGKKVLLGDPHTHNPGDVDAVTQKGVDPKYAGALGVQQQGQQLIVHVHHANQESGRSVLEQAVLEAVQGIRDFHNWPVTFRWASQGQLEILERGVDAWNLWRKQNRQEVIDLSGAQLQGAQLAGADLEGARLREANLSDANLSKAILIEADLAKAKLNKANLKEADLTWAHLEEAILDHQADLTGAHLIVAHLTKAKLPGAKLPGAKLPGADLTGADLLGADLTGADLREVHLREASLIRANLTKADLTKADLTLAELLQADLRGATYTQMQLQQAHNWDQAVRW